jgi:hypothetical protein
MYTIRIVIVEFYKTKRTFTKLKSRKIKHSLRQSIERTQDTFYKNRLRFRTFLPHRYNPGRAPTAIEGGGTAAQISAAKHLWEEATTCFKTYNAVQSTLKKQSITVIEPMYIEILNDDLFGFSNTTSQDMLDHLFLSYGRVTAVYIEQNFENM